MNTPPIPFVPGQKYTRADVYEILAVPEQQRRGNWETGYNRWGDNLYIFSTVGAPATGGYDYANRWENGEFVWYAKERTNLKQPQIRWMLAPTGNILVFTRPGVREPYTFEGLASPISWEDSSPVLIRWRIERELSGFTVLPTEVSAPGRFIEGATHRVFVNRYERDPQARKACIEHYGCHCRCCGFDFLATYGEIGRDFIHVHHLRELASIGEAYEVDPIADLRPVCPNCHAMLHTQTPALTVEQLRAIVASVCSA
jgi:5-methylcytosine-specific restriction protein A